MSSFLHPLVFSFDAALVMITAWLAVRWFAEELPSVLEQMLAWGLIAVALVAGAGVLLGLTGGLGLWGFAGVHLLFLGGILFGRRTQLREDLASGQTLVANVAAAIDTRGEKILFVFLLLAMALLAAMALVTQPVVFDALTYRLSRIGHWLQEGRIGVIGGDDARLNYMPVVPDLVMAWLLGGSTSGFNAVAAAQACGGVLALGATIGFARQLGLARAPSLAAAILVLGLPNVAPQFMSAYTDLFTTGVLAAGIYLWLAALRRGAGSRVGGLAAGLALGAKGTVMYFAPGLLLALGWLAWRHRAGRAAWGRTVAAGVLAGLVFVAPAMVRNLRTYGGPFGPEDFVVLHHGKSPGLAGSVEKLRLNLTSSLVQLLEPNSQLSGWRKMTQSLGETIMSGLPTEDPYAFQGLNRRANLEKIYAVAAPDADVASTGVLLPVLALLAAGTALWRRKSADGELALVWSIALVLFVLCLHWRVQWHPYLFRFLGLAAPWLAAVVVWWIMLLPWRQRAVVWIVTMAATLSGLGGALFNTYQSGWPAIAHPEQSTGYFVYAGWRNWAANFDQPAEPLQPALDVNAPLAAFYRQETPRRVLPQSLSAISSDSAGALVQPGDGWIIVPVARFIGKEGRVMGRVWLYDGDEHHPYSVAAFRALRDGEQPVSLVYRNRVVEKAGQVQREFVLRTWSPFAQRVELSNPGTVSCSYTVYSSVGGTAGELAPGARLLLELPLPADTVTVFGVSYPKPGPGTGWVEAKLLP